MAKFNFVRDGAMRLPPGFRFQPTDEELVFRYLKCKVFSFPLPASIIPDVNLCKYDPWDLPGWSLLYEYRRAHIHIYIHTKRHLAKGLIHLETVSLSRSIFLCAFNSMLFSLILWLVCIYSLFDEFVKFY